MNEPNPELAVETMIKFLIILNAVFIIISIVKGNNLSIVFSITNLLFLLLRQGIKSKISAIKGYKI